jgi:hypothetical protein
MSRPSIIEALSEGIWSDTESLDLELPAAGCINAFEHDSIIPRDWMEAEINEYARMNRHGLYFMTDLYPGDGTRLVRTCLPLYDVIFLTRIVA